MITNIYVRTRITEMLGIKYPIFQGGMAWVAYPPLVAAVSNAGGLGILGGVIFPPSMLKEEIGKIRQLTDKPFGVNILAKSPILDEVLDVLIEEKPDVVTYGLGDPQRIIQRLKPYKIKCIPVVPSVSTCLLYTSDAADDREV